MKKKPQDLTLAFDSSSAGLTMSLFSDERVLATKNLSKISRGKTHLAVYYLEKMLKQKRCDICQLKTAAFGLGPGSYTGLRIGLATLKALLLANPKLKAVGFSSLDLIAAGIKKNLFAVFMDARREKIYANFYKHEGHSVKRLFEKPLLISIHEGIEEAEKIRGAQNIAIAGDGLRVYGSELKKHHSFEFLPEKFWYPKASNALCLIQGAGALEMKDIRPLYMRRSEAEEKWGLCYDERDLEK